MAPTVGAEVGVAIGATVYTVWVITAGNDTEETVGIVRELKEFTVDCTLVSALVKEVVVIEEAAEEATEAWAALTPAV